MKDVKVEIIGKNYEKLHEIGNLPHELNNIIVKAKENNLTRAGVTFALLLVVNLKDKQIVKNKMDQLQLFDQEMFDVENETNYTVVLSFHYSDFLPKGNKNYNQVKKGINELRKLEYTLKVDLNKDKIGKPSRIVTYNSNFILNYVEEEKKGFKILIDKYWYRLLINITDGFNPYLKSIVYNLKSLNLLQFYFYIKKLPKIEKTAIINYKGLYEVLGDAAVESKGTITYVDNFIETLHLPYKFESQIARDYLDICRNEFNKKSDICFNYKFENNKIYIITYPGNTALISENISKAETVKIKSAINYKVRKYDLEKNEAMLLIEVYIKYGYDFVTKATNKNSSLKGLKSEKYFTVFTNLVNMKFKKLNIPIDSISYTAEDKIKIRKELFSKLGNLNKELNQDDLDEISKKYAHLKNKGLDKK